MLISSKKMPKRFELILAAGWLAWIVTVAVCPGAWGIQAAAQTTHAKVIEKCLLTNMRPPREQAVPTSRGGLVSTVPTQNYLANRKNFAPAEFGTVTCHWLPT